MTEFKPQETDFIGLIKKQFKDFIKNCESLTNKQKEKLIKELGDNWFDNRFQAACFIPTAISHAMNKWQAENFDLVDLWKKIVVSNASINNNPQDTANDVIEEFKKKFNVND